MLAAYRQMVKGKRQLTPYEKQCVASDVIYRRRTPNGAALHYRVDVRTVYHVLEDFKNNIPFDRKPGSGRPSNLTPNVKIRLTDIIRRNRTATSKQLAGMYNRNSVLKISDRTACRWRRMLGAKPTLARKKPKIPPAARPKRLSFALAHLNDDFSTWISVDECSV